METQTESSIAPGQRITHAFERARSEGRGALIPYLMCGYPDEEQSVHVIQGAIDGGADIIELGLPFSDPLADGVVIQHAGHAALDSGMSMQGCMRVAARISSHNDTPLVFMGYYNPILAYGLQRFCEDARQNGICGLIIPDLPPDEAEPLREATMREGIALIFMIPPTIRNERIARIADLASQGPGGFIYCVSRSGVTGSRSDLPPDLESFIARIRGYTEEKHIPLVVGFGLSTPEHIRQVTQYAEGAAVGSALVKLIGQHSPEEQPMTVKNYIQSLRGL